jgi:thiamine pyrophosphate-dependent acetolactate synthase large subunit-like protein
MAAIVGWSENSPLRASTSALNGECVDLPQEIAPALQRAVDSGKPALVNVCVDLDARAAGGLLGQLGSERARYATRAAI